MGSPKVLSVSYNCFVLHYRIALGRRICSRYLNFCEQENPCQRYYTDRQTDLVGSKVDADQQYTPFWLLQTFLQNECTFR